MLTLNRFSSVCIVLQVHAGSLFVNTPTYMDIGYLLQAKETRV